MENRDLFIGLALVLGIVAFVVAMIGTGGSDGKNARMSPTNFTGSCTQCILGMSSSSTPDGGDCWCDEYCVQNGDCCGNYASLCQSPTNVTSNGKIQEAYLLRATAFTEKNPETTSAYNVTTIELWKNGGWDALAIDIRQGASVYLEGLEFTVGAINKNDRTVVLRNGGNKGFMILNDEVKFDKDTDSSFVLFYAN